MREGRQRGGEKKGTKNIKLKDIQIDGNDEEKVESEKREWEIWVKRADTAGFSEKEKWQALEAFAAAGKGAAADETELISEELEPKTEREYKTAIRHLWDALYEVHGVTKTGKRKETDEDLKNLKFPAEADSKALREFGRQYVLRRVKQQKQVPLASRWGLVRTRPKTIWPGGKKVRSRKR